MAEREPSEALRKCDGNDIVKSGRQRKNRYLCSIPGLLAVKGAGRVGTLVDLDTPRPKLVLGDLVFRGRFAKASTMMLRVQGKGLACKDVFDRVLVFEQVEWTGLPRGGDDGDDDETRGADFEYGLSTVARPGLTRKKTPPLSTTTNKKKPPDDSDVDDSDDLPSQEEEEEEEAEAEKKMAKRKSAPDRLTTTDDPSIASQRPKRARTVQSYCEAPEAEEEEDDDDFEDK